MIAGELYALFRSSTGDTMSPYVWSDVEVYTYINDAYWMFVRKTGGIPDYLTDAVCLVQATQNLPFSNLHSSILNIRMATLEPGGETVKLINAQDMESLSDEDFGVFRQLNSSTTKGRVRYMVIGMQPDKAKWVNIPDANYNVRLLVDRLPLNTIQTATDVFEGVKDQHHLHFLKWARYLAFSKPEVANNSEAAREMEEFDTYCELARREKERYKHKVRIVRYGGI